MLKTLKLKRAISRIIKGIDSKKSLRIFLAPEDETHILRTTGDGLRKLALGEGDISVQLTKDGHKMQICGVATYQNAFVPENTALIFVGGSHQPVIVKFMN